MEDATRLLRAVRAPTEQGAAFTQGPVFAGTYQAAGDPASAPFTYGRYHNPTWSAYENALAELEGAPSLVFASGMAAVTAVLATTLKPGDTVLMPSDSYYTARVLVDNYFGSIGVTVRRAPTANDGQIEHVKGARLVWLESPTNPGLDVCDLRKVIDAAHAQGALVAVDNTTPTPLGQQDRTGRGFQRCGRYQGNHRARRCRARACRRAGRRAL